MYRHYIKYAVELLGSVGVFSLCRVSYFCGLFCFLISEKEDGGRKKNARGFTLGWIDTHSSLVGFSCGILSWK